MVVKTLKRVGAIAWTGVHGLRVRFSQRRPAAILYYHAVGRPAGPGMVEPDRFARQAEWLAERGIVRPLEELLDGAEGVAVVFDDAYRSVLTEADPVLATLRLPYTVAVPTGAVGRRAAWDTGLDDEASSVLSWEELGSLSPQVTFASHTVTHRPVWRLSDEEQVDELTRSREALRERFGSRALDVVVWPYGRGDARAVTAARRLGYRWCLAGGWETLHTFEAPEWRRTLVEHDDTLFDFRLKVAGGWDWLDFVRRLRER